MEMVFEIEGGDFTKAGLASTEVKKVLKQLNIEPAKIKKIAVAMYEAEVNIVAHARRGTMTVNIDSHLIQLKFEDEGPGIQDIDMAMTEGFSTASDTVRQMGFGAGMGLPNIKKNVDELNISSEVDKGTMVEFKTYLDN
ncbi:MAG: ATP-binding protein [Bacteroidales bacterium]|nr:ATP-binding protein [Bacteroidales bacterium]